jgi:hypothetical protein
VLSCLAFIILGFQHDPKRAAPKQLQPYVTISGSFSEIAQARHLRIVDQKDWAAVWREHRGKEAEKNAYSEPVVPDVNFQGCMVVAVFRGQTVNSNGLYLVSLEDRADAIVLRYDSHSFQTASLIGDPGGGASAVRPYGIFVVPRSDKELVIEQNVQNLKNHPPIWKERARFQALDQL